MVRNQNVSQPISEFHLYVFAIFKYKKNGESIRWCVGNILKQHCFEHNCEQYSWHEHNCEQYSWQIPNCIKKELSNHQKSDIEAHRLLLDHVSGGITFAKILANSYIHVVSHLSHIFKAVKKPVNYLR